MFVVSHKDKKIASCHKKLLNTEFAWDKNCVSPAAIVSGVPCLIRKEMVRVSHCDEEWKRLQDDRLECEKWYLQQEKQDLTSRQA